MQKAPLRTSNFIKSTHQNTLLSEDSFIRVILLEGNMKNIVEYIILFTVSQLIIEPKSSKVHKDLFLIQKQK